MQRIIRLLSWLLTFCLISGVSIAHEQEMIFNKVNLQASADREIDNDEMLVIMVAEHQGRDPAELAEDINRDMKWALDITKKQRSLNASTRSYQTYPIYKNRIIRTWQASQELAIKGTDFSAIMELVGDLQERLQVRQMSLNPTIAMRKAAEDELIEEAVQAFKSRAAIVSKQMDEKDYRIIDMNIHTNNHIQPPMHFAAQAEMGGVMGFMDQAAPVVEAGTSRIVVTVSGSVQFY